MNTYEITHKPNFCTHSTYEKIIPPLQQTHTPPLVRILTNMNLRKFINSTVYIQYFSMYMQMHTYVTHI